MSQETVEVLAVALLLLATAVGSVGWFAWRWRARGRRAEAQLAELREELAAARRALGLVEESWASRGLERTALADDVLEQLDGTVRGLERAARGLSGLEPGSARMVRGASEEAERRIGELRRVLHDEPSKWEDWTTFDVAAITQDIVNRVNAEQAGVDVTANVAGAPAQLLGDASRIASIIEHLVHHTAVRTAVGAVELVVAGGDQLMNVVIHGGGQPVGAPEADELTESGEMALVRRQIEQLGGELSFQADGAGGTLITVELPIAPAEPVRPAGSAMASADGDSGRSAGDQLGDQLGDQPGDAWRVLIVDDNPINRRVATEALSRRGFRTQVACDGQEALDAHGAQPFDLILMDCRMPVLDGIGATRAIRGWDGPAASVPIIAVTASPHPGDRERCTEAGMNAYVLKPVDFSMLGTLMRELLGDPVGGDQGERVPEEPHSMGVAGSEAGSEPGSEPLSKTDAPVDEVDRSLLGLLIEEPEDVDFAQSMVDDIFERFEQWAPQLRDALQRGPCGDGLRLAHDLKAMFATLGLSAMAERFRVIERAVADTLDEGLEDGAAEWSEHLISELDAAKQLAPTARRAVEQVLSDWDSAEEAAA